jgi:hypothetical protein
VLAFPLLVHAPAGIDTVDADSKKHYDTAFLQLTIC